MELPLQNEGGEAFPGTGRCLLCDKAGIGEPGQFVCVSGGAVFEASPGNGGPHDQMQGFLNVAWHGAHSNSSQEPWFDEGWASVNIIDGVRRGQFQLFFCSTRCFRGFFQQVADKLEASRPAGP